jgi:predicted nucleotidyltransferase
MGYAQQLHDMPVIERIVRRIVASIHPQRVILFGSRARGDAAPDSDVDMLVVVDDVHARHAVAVRVREAIGPEALPVDIIIRDQQELSHRARLPGSVERAAMREGLIIYAA